MNYTKAAAGFIVILMALSVFGYVGGSFFSESNEKEEYNGFSFIKVNNQWMVRESEESYYFTHLPPELENLTIPPEFQITDQRLYLAFQPNDKVDMSKSINFIGTILYRKDFLLQQACVSEKGCPDIPIINCYEDNGFVFVSGTENGYSGDEKCLIITATDYEQLEKLTERLAYGFLGIIP